MELERHGENGTELYFFINKTSEIIPANWLLQFYVKQKLFQGLYAQFERHGTKCQETVLLLQKKKERSIRVIERFNENSKQKLIQGLYSQLENHGKKATEMYWFQDKISETIPGNWMLWY